MLKRFQVFISSTFEDLKQERQAVLKAVIEMGHLPAGMEMFPASDETAWRLITDTIDASDYYVLIIGGRYGSLDETDLGFTEKEYDYAIGKQKPIIALLHSRPDDLPRAKTDTDAHAWERLRRFRTKVERKHTCSQWSGPEELRSKVTTGLTYAIEKYPAVGWSRVADAESQPTIHRNLFEAGPSVIGAIRGALSKRHESTLHIYILGGRIRTIFPMLEQVFQDIESGALRAHDAVFTICCFATDKMTHWQVPGVSSQDDLRQRLTTQAEELRGHIDDLVAYGRHRIFRERRVDVNILPYEGLPTVYGFVVGDSDIFWGQYCWNEESEDFEGPLNPCLQMDRTMGHFRVCKEVLLNRVALWALAGGEQTRLDHALRVNRGAYDAVASDYKRRSTVRERAMEIWLEPFTTELHSTPEAGVTVLDVGSGDGLISAYFAKRGCKVTAIDFSHAMCVRARSHGSIENLIEAEFLTNDFTDCRFDSVLAVAFIHLFPPPSDQRVLRRIREVMRDDGLAFVSTTVHDRPVCGYTRKVGFRGEPLRFRRHYTREEFVRLLEDAGFAIVRSYDTKDPFNGRKSWMNFVLKKAPILKDTVSVPQTGGDRREENRAATPVQSNAANTEVN